MQLLFPVCYGLTKLPSNVATSPLPSPSFLLFLRSIGVPPSASIEQRLAQLVSHFSLLLSQSTMLCSSIFSPCSLPPLPSSPPCLLWPPATVPAAQLTSHHRIVSDSIRLPVPILPSLPLPPSPLYSIALLSRSSTPNITRERERERDYYSFTAVVLVGWPWPPARPLAGPTRRVPLLLLRGQVVRRQRDQHFSQSE